MLFEISLAILILVLGLQIIRRFGGLFGIKNFNLRYIFIISILIIFGMLFYQSYQQYQIWSQNGPSKFLLPPYQNINYFAFYVFMRFFVSYLISLVAAIVFLIVAKVLNKKYEERFFEPEEFWLGALAIFLVGYPGWLFYLVFVVLLYSLIHIFSLLISRFSSSRISLYWLWIPTAIFVIIIGKWLQTLSLWSLLKL